MSKARRPAVTEYQRARKHELWLRETRAELQLQLIILTRERKIRITRKLLILLTLEPHLLESLRQKIRAMPPGTTHELCLNWSHSKKHEGFCKEPPSDADLQATATELARTESIFNSLRTLRLNNAPAFIALPFLMTNTESCARVPGIVQSTFSIKSLRQIYIHDLAFPDSASMDAFCQGMETSAVELLWMFHVSFPPEHREQVATTLARSKTLVDFDYFDAISSFYNPYCAALSNNADTKLERLKLGRAQLHGDHGEFWGDPAVVGEIRKLLKLNVQRKTSLLLIAAADNAVTDARRKQCLKKLETVDISVVFESIRSNQYNVISSIQRLCCSRKRQREDG